MAYCPHFLLFPNTVPSVHVSNMTEYDKALGTCMIKLEPVYIHILHDRDSFFVVSAILKSIAWPLTLISAANMIDNPWHCVTQRSKEVGIELANVLLARHQVSPYDSLNLTLYNHCLRTRLQVLLCPRMLFIRNHP